MEVHIKFSFNCGTSVDEKAIDCSELQPPRNILFATVSVNNMFFFFQFSIYIFYISIEDRLVVFISLNYLDIRFNVDAFSAFK